MTPCSYECTITLMAAQTKSKKTSETTPEMVWDIFENTWVTREYWEWVNGRDPQKES